MVINIKKLKVKGQLNNSMIHRVKQIRDDDKRYGLNKTESDELQNQKKKCYQIYEIFYHNVYGFSLRWC